MALAANVGGGQNILDNSFQYDIQFAGIIPEILADMDLTARTDILRVIDEAKREKRIGHHVTPENDASLILNAFSLRVLSRQDQELLLCVPVHMLAAIGFVKESDQHILAIKIGEIGGNKEVFDLAVVYCTSSKQAEEICDIMGRCFQSVFTEATSQYIGKQVVEGKLTNPNLALYGLGTEPGEPFKEHETQSHTPEGSSRGDIRGGRQPHILLHPSSRATTTQSESDQFSAYAAEQIQNYMHMLHLALSAEELKQFAVLLTRWRSENLPFPEFCQKVLELYGSERRNLLAGMKPFILEKDLGYFENFLVLSAGGTGEGVAVVEIHAQRQQTQDAIEEVTEV